ncbi:MAG: hypothetical protein B6245_23485 [Desulfobacteraceae bacterium 4572_88]|nr:MAG: hypothetical protein B6245_23485 [Desulfobacteraceae bacterium 4572_88]
MLCKGTGSSLKDSHTSFYPNGALLRYCYTPTDNRICNIPCKGGFWHIIEFHQNGKLMEYTLAEDTIIEGVEIKSGKTI